MTFPKLKINEIEFTLDPELIQEIARQLPAQLKNMTLTEMIEAGKAIKDAGESTGIGKMVRMIGKGNLGRVE